MFQVPARGPDQNRAMTIFIMTGPSLPPEIARQELDAVYLPPVSEGDVYRAVDEMPDAIGIIDGYFECVPSVWHKEILYAMSRGIRVFGAASMGALRAAELAAFGMEGIGAIFEAFREGILEDDDEVAVIHGPPEFGYPVLSEAMVNIRRTLSDAALECVIVQETRTRLESIAKDLPYRDRTFAALIEEGKRCRLPAEELHAFQQWLPNGRVDQKREDALLMLRTMRAQVRTGATHHPARFHFEHTTLWERAARLAATQNSPFEPV